MSGFKKIIILILLLTALAAGIFYRNDILKFFSKGLQDFQKTDVGSIISEAGKEIFTPPPLIKNLKGDSAVLLKSKVIEETNVQRINNGLSELTENKKLDEAAAIKANDMFLNQYFEHISPSGVNPGQLVQSVGYDYIITGENLILGNFVSEQEMINDWMNSPGHRANILNNRFTEIGMAVIKGTYQGNTVWIGVQEFGLPLSTCLQPNTALKLRIDTNKKELESLSSEINQKKTEINNTNPRSSQYNLLVNQYNQLIEQYNYLAEETKRFVNQYNQDVSVFNACVKGQ